MEELIRTNDVVLISLVTSMLKEMEIVHMVLDENMSILDGSIGAIPRRVMVDADRANEFRRVMKDAGLENELRDQA